MSFNFFKKNTQKAAEDNQPLNQPAAKDARQAPEFELRTVANARSWVGSLPMADMGETTKRLFAALTQLNNDSLPPQVRVDITEILLPYVKMALENLDRHFLSRTFPLPERSQKVFDLKKALLMELAGSYQLAALDMLMKNAGPRKTLLICIGKAMQYMSMVIVNDYGIYAKNKKSTWRDLHHLYSLACREDIQAVDIPHPEDINGENLSIEDQYKLINLIALVSPNSLRQDEITKVREFFIATLDDVKIADPELMKSKYVHACLLNGDSPANLMLRSELLDGEASCVFDLSALILKADQFIGLSEANELGKHEKWPMLSHSLAKRLVHVLTTIRKRRLKRFERDDKASLVLRMPEVINLIRDNEPESFMDEINEDVEEDNIYQALAAEDNTSSPWVDLDVDELAENRDVTIHTWQIENSSTGGYGLRQRDTEKTTVRVGELIALKDPKDTSENWQITVTRWMDSYKDVGLRIGLEVLSTYGLVVKVENVANRRITQKLPLKGILLPAIEGAREEPNLIFPGFIFQVEDELTLLLGEQEQKVIISAIDDTVGSFAYCKFDVVEPEENEDGSLESFNDVWEFL